MHQTFDCGKWAAQYPGKPADSHSSTMSLTISVQVSQPHKLISWVLPLCRVNSYKCHSNGTSDADSYLKERKMWPGVGNGCRILLTVQKGCMFMRLNHVHTSCASSKGLYWGSLGGLKYLIFLQWVWFSSDFIRATPTRQPSLKIYGLARLAGLLWGIRTASPTCSYSTIRNFRNHNSSGQCTGMGTWIRRVANTNVSPNSENNARECTPHKREAKGTKGTSINTVVQKNGQYVSPGDSIIVGHMNCD